MEPDSIGTPEKAKARVIYQKRRVLCSKNSQFFKKQHLPKIQEAVLRTNHIVQNAFYFLKFTMLEDFEQLFESNDGDMDKVSSEFANLHPLDKQQFQSILTIVSSEFVKKKGRPHHDKETIQQLYS